MAGASCGTPAVRPAGPGHYLGLRVGPSGVGVPSAAMKIGLSFRRDLLLLVAGVPAGYAFGLGLAAMGFGFARWLLPLLLAAPAIQGLWRYLQAGERDRALRLMLGWTLALAVFGPIAMAVAPEAAREAVLRGESYRDGMMAWLSTGEGAEGDIRQFLPIHLQRLVVFLPLSWVSGGALGLLMGTAMMNYMNFFVASYAAASAGIPAVLAWFPWSLCRVTAFVILGVVTAEPLVRRFGRVRAPLQPGRGRLLWLAGGLLAADVALKAALAPAWGRFLAGFLV